MNTIATITGQAYRAAYAIAPRKDIRPQLNGIHINTEDSEIAATDGHMLYINDVELGDEPGSSVIFEPVKIPARVDTVEICRYTNDAVMLHVGDSQHICRLIDLGYPNYQAVIPTTSGDRKSIAFDVKYLAILKQIFKRGVALTFNGTPGACKITGVAKEGMVVLMECR